MTSDNQIEITITKEPFLDQKESHFEWIDDETLSLIPVITNPVCGAIDDHPAFLYRFYTRFNNIGCEWSNSCLDPTTRLDTPFNLGSSDVRFPKIGDLITVRAEEYDRKEKTTTDMGEIKLTVPEKPIPTFEATFEVPNHSNVEIKSDDGLIQLYRVPYTCTLNKGKVYLFHIRTEGSLRRLADIRLRTTDEYTIECLELDGDSIWCGRSEAPGVAISADNTVTAYVGPEIETKEDVLATLKARGFIPFTQLPPYQSAGSGWTQSEGIPEANYKKEWGNSLFEMWVSGVNSNPPNSTNAISWTYRSGTTITNCKKDDPPTTGACKLRPLATALLDSAINELYIGLPESLMARLADTIPSEDISVEAGSQFQCAIEVTNWSWESGRIRARIEATMGDTEPWTRSEDGFTKSMSSIGFNDVITMPHVKSQLDFYAEHYDADSETWIIDDMKRVVVATKDTAMLQIHEAVDGYGIPFKDQENVSILWDGKDCGIHPPAELIIGSGYYCDEAKLVETSLGRHIITVKREGFLTARKEFERIVAGKVYEFSPVLSKEGEEPEEVDMMGISEFYALIAAKEAPINTFCDEATGEGICDCTEYGSQEERIWCKNAGKSDVLEPMSLSPSSTLEGGYPDKPNSFKSWCGEYPTPDNTQGYIEEWWSRAIELAFNRFEIYVQSEDQYLYFIPALIDQIQGYDEVIVSIIEDDDYDTPYPRRIYFPLDPDVPGGATYTDGQRKLFAVLLTKDPSGHFSFPQAYIGPFRYLKSDWSGGRVPSLLYRDWAIDGTRLGGAIELEYWEDSNPPSASDIAFTKFYPELSVPELPRAMLEQAMNALPFMTEKTYAELQLMQAIDKNTRKKLTSVEVWWDGILCGGYSSDWEKLIGPGKTIGSKDCEVNFGIHTITLKKDEYADFSTTIDFKPGNEYLIIPELVYTGEDGEVPTTEAYVVINPTRHQDGRQLWAEIWIGEAKGKGTTFTTGRSTSATVQTLIKFCNGCTYGFIKNKVKTELNKEYNIDLKEAGYVTHRTTFTSTPGVTRTIAPTFVRGTYDATTVVIPSENPENIYTNTEDNLTIRVINTGSVDADYTVTVIFEGIDVDKEYRYESETIYIVADEEVVATVPIIIPTDAIPEGKNIANYIIRTQVIG